MILCSKCGDNYGPFILLRGPEVYLCEDCWEKRKEEIYKEARRFSKENNLPFTERKEYEAAIIRS